MMLHQVLRQLGIQNFTVKINHRKILTGIAEIIGAEGREGTLCVAIDKLDKIGKDGVADELIQQGFTQANLEDRKSTRLNSSHVKISYAVFCLKKKKNICTD